MTPLVDGGARDAPDIRTAPARMSHVDYGIVAVLAAVFLLSAMDKIVHYGGFVDALRNYVLVPYGAAPLIASPIISVELGIGIGLLVSPWRRQAALVAAVMLALFTLAIGLNYLLGGRGICGCWFTVTLAEGTASHLLLNAMLMALALLLWHQNRPLSPRPLPA